MKHLVIGIAGMLIFGLCGCKTSEANYRAAYEKAVAGRDKADETENSVYDANRRSIDSRQIIVGGDTVEARVDRVVVTLNGGGLPENLKAYSVVVGRFKQEFNAKSMRNRLVQAGFHNTFVVNNAEPYYYVVLSSHTTQAEAVKALKDIPTSFPAVMKSPLPYILYRP